MDRPVVRALVIESAALFREHALRRCDALPPNRAFVLNQTAGAEPDFDRFVRTGERSRGQGDLTLIASIRNYGVKPSRYLKD
jgi:hypothetical protein